MRKTTIVKGILLFCLALLVVSCREKQHIIVSKSSLIYSNSGGNDVFQIQADCNWEISGMTDWITVNPTTGNGDGNVVVTVTRNNTTQDRSALLYIISDNGKVKKNVEVIQVKADIHTITQKVWFTVTDERWDTDFYNDVIPESYRSYSYYANEGFENWFFYFLNDSIGYQIRTFEGDTIYYPYNYSFYADFDSLFISFEIVDDTVAREDYHTVIHQLDNEYFVFSHAYRPHQFEKITTANVTGDRRAEIKINKKKIQTKPKGPLIPVK